MTKTVRIENADTSSHKVHVQVWDKGAPGEPDHLAETRCLDYPTTMSEICIHSHRYLVVKEVS